MTIANQFDHPAAGITSSGLHRLIGLDVARAVALIGVVVMNYHGTMNFSSSKTVPRDFWNRIFNIRTGVLSTHFAATFVVIAGISVVLLTRTNGHGRNTERLVRRGLVLLIIGYFLNEAWPGTIIFYYGTYYLAAAIIHRWRTRYLVVLSTSIVVSAAAIAMWRRARALDGHSTQWMNPSEIDSIRDFFLRVFIGYTHPILPWLAFFCTGMIIGRDWGRISVRPRPVLTVAIGTIVGTYLLATVARMAGWRDGVVINVVTAMEPSRRGIFYVLSTAAIAVLAVLSIDFLARSHDRSRLVRHLQRAGQMTLSLYFLHVLFYYVVVDWGGMISTPNLAAALLVACSFWIMAVAIGSWWHHRLGRGPAERLYRWLGG